MPAFPKLHLTDVTQRGVKAPVVVKRQPVNHLIHRLPAGCKPLSVQAADLQATPQASCGSVVAQPQGSPAVALAAHRALHLVAHQRALEHMPTVLGYHDLNGMFGLAWGGAGTMPSSGHP